ncbi:MAG: manganese efflux pump [Clostridia bacterium]|nr:manganese efflux pump [Clostridia bacterium]
MHIIDLLMIAAALSADAFAASVCKGIACNKQRFRAAFACALYFSVFQCIMPLLGYMLSIRIGAALSAVSPYIAFVLLTLVGVGMIRNEQSSSPSSDHRSGALSFSSMLPLAVATSIDALAAGVSFALLHVHMPSALLIIAVTTFALCSSGAAFGSLIGSRLQSAAQTAGGCILILMGFRILLSHLLA